MLRRRTWLRISTVSHWATTWVLLIGYAGAALGVPLPLPSVASDSSSSPAYPCQTSRCGCRTAEQCWKSCCCHTSRERLAWAEAHGVTPPSYLVAAVAEESQPRLPRSCCSHKHGQPASAKTAASTMSTPPVGIQWISSLDLARCRGAAPEWNNVPISLPAAEPLAAPEFEPRVCVIAPFLASDPYCPSFSPANPPPWIH